MEEMGPHDQGEEQALDRQPRWHVCGLGLVSEDCPASLCLHFAVFEMGSQEGRMQSLMRTPRVSFCIACPEPSLRSVINVGEASYLVSLAVRGTTPGVSLTPSQNKISNKWRGMRLGSGRREEENEKTVILCGWGCNLVHSL